MHIYPPKTPHLSMDLEIKPTGFLALMELDDELEFWRIDRDGRVAVDTFWRWEVR